MKQFISILLAFIGWFAVITQYYLMIENRVAPVGETTIRFFSFFTILTNSLVAFYFTLIAIKAKDNTTSEIKRPGTLTAITVYITIVGAVYQIVLRPLWHPEGLQKLVDELLHTLIPICVIVYWFLYENYLQRNYNKIPQWLIYPLVYLIFILIRGAFSGFYPYPFIDAGKLGLTKVLVNSLFLILFFGALSAFLIRIKAPKKTSGIT